MVAAGVIDPGQGDALGPRERRLDRRHDPDDRGADRRRSREGRGRPRPPWTTRSTNRIAQPPRRPVPAGRFALGRDGRGVISTSRMRAGVGLHSSGPGTKQGWTQSGEPPSVAGNPIRTARCRNRAALWLPLGHNRTCRIHNPRPLAKCLPGRRHARALPAHRDRWATRIQSRELKAAVLDGARCNPPARRGDALSNRDDCLDFGSVDFRFPSPVAKASRVSVRRFSSVK